MYDQHVISIEEHYEYLKKQQKNLDFFNWIICCDRRNVGYTRILDGDVSIMIEQSFHNKGIGTRALKQLENEAKALGLKKLIARIKIDNKNSKSIFKKNGYRLNMNLFEKDII